MLHLALRPMFAAIVLAIAATALGTGQAAAQPAEAGSVRFAKPAESSFDRFTRSTAAGEQEWMRSKYWRMRTYSPYFDSRLAWYGNAWVYQDLYAIYPDDEVAEQHPDWILRDSAGNKLYIPFGCSGGTCPQYAGDFGNPDFRAWWIKSAGEKLSKGYRGLFVDDVNMDLRVGNGRGAAVVPHDPRTGERMTEGAWRRYLADFTEQIRAAFPGKEIVHNAIWYAGCGSEPGSCWSDPHIRRQLLAADYIELERGVNDDGITGGGGRWGYQTFMSRIDWLHSQGKGVVFDSGADDAVEREYELASYFLVSNGNDGLGSGHGSSPGDWWTGYDVQLGAPHGPRRHETGLLRRDFAHGYVLVNPPGGGRRQVELEAGATGPDGAPRASVELGGGEGAVVVTGSARPGRDSRADTETVVDPQPHPVASVIPQAPERIVRKMRRLPRAVLVRGRVKRAPGGHVRIRLQRKHGSHWRQVRSVRVVVKQGHFRRLFRHLPKGRYRVRAAYLGSAKATMSASHARRFRIRGRIHAR